MRAWPRLLFGVRWGAFFAWGFPPQPAPKGSILSCKVGSLAARMGSLRSVCAASFGRDCGG